MRIPPSELIDKMSILKLKIERIGEPHLNNDYEKCELALSDYAKKTFIRSEWLGELYEINKKIWDLDFDIRDLVNREEDELSDDNLEKIGRDSLMILDLMKERVNAKNKIVESTGVGFKEIKKNHPSE